MKHTGIRGLTRSQLLALPATVDLPTAGRACGIGRGLSYELAARNEFPCRVLRLGARYRVVTAELLELLGITPEMRTGPAATAEPATAALNAQEEVRRDHGSASPAA